VGGWASLVQNKLFFDYTFYRLEGNNELLGVRLPDNTTDYLSAGKTLHEGIEYQITYRPNDSWNFRFGGTNAKHTFVDFVLSTRAADALKNVNGKEMPQAPNFIANSEVTYKYKGARIALEWQRIGPWFENQVNTRRYEGASVLNLRTGYTYKAYQIFANVLNLGDALYASAATRGNNATDRATYTPAPPRTFVLGLQIDVFQLFKK
jgi:outer membrane receptor protein involved in Fe transport